MNRSYNWAAKGRSPEDAVWKQAPRGEVAKAQGNETGSALVDLVKAFEMVKLELVWQAGLRLHFPPIVLRMVLETFALGRRLVLDKAVAPVVRTLSAVLAGGSFATDALFMILARTCDGMIVEHPSVDLCVFVDDITLSVSGSPQHVAATLPAAFEDLVAELKRELHLVVSKSAKRWALDPQLPNFGDCQLKRAPSHAAANLQGSGRPNGKIHLASGSRLRRGRENKPAALDKASQEGLREKSCTAGWGQRLLTGSSAQGRRPPSGMALASTAFTKPA